MAITSPRASSTVFRVPARQLYGDWKGLLERGEFLPFAQSLIGWNSDVAGAVDGIMSGKTNNTLAVTLTASQATTTVTDARIGSNTVLILVPITANAAAEVGAGGLYQTRPNATENQAVLNHANNAQTDRDFIAVLVG